LAVGQILRFSSLKVLQFFGPSAQLGFRRHCYSSGLRFVFVPRGDEVMSWSGSGG